MIPKDLQGPISIAVIGTGAIGMRHLMVLHEIPGVCAIAVPKREGRADELTKQGWLAACNIGEAANMGATLGIIASASGQHLEDGLTGLKSGLNLLIEKPLATHMAEARDLANCAKDVGQSIFVGCVLRFSESLGEFRDLLPRIGRLHSVHIECQSYLPDWHPDRPYQDSYSAQADEGGVLRDLIHEIDYAGWLFGWPVSLQATVRNLGRLDIGADETANLSWETPDHCAISLRLDYLSKPPRREITACGERGTVEWDGVAQTVTLSPEGQPVSKFRSDQTRDEMFLAQDIAFLDAVRGSVDPKLATGNDGVKALAVCDTARLASDSRSEENVEYP